MNAISTTTTRKKTVIRIAAVTVLILSIPLIAMQFSEEVDWGLYDFVVIGALLFGTGMIYEFGITKLRTTAQQMVAAAVLLAVLFLIWAELAVGIFGSPFAGS